MSEIYDVVNKLNDPFVVSRVTKQPIEDRMDYAKMCQVYTFWREIQEILEEGSCEIKKLRQQIAELENDRDRKTDT